MIIRLFLISRPRFWMYPIGTFLIGLGAAGSLTDQVSVYPIIALWLLYFTFPSNIFMYGINDMADTDTDSFNQKKDVYELRVKRKEFIYIVVTVLFLHILFLPVFLGSTLAVKSAFLVYFFGNIVYSLPPLRLKAIPYADSISNGIITGAVGVIGYLVAGGVGINWYFVLAGSLWAVAMHAFSAIPDIEADRGVGVRTIATKQGEKNTVIICMFIYGLICAFLIYQGVILQSLLVTPYFVLMLWTWLRLVKEKEIFSVYKVFPYVTYLVGYLVYLSTVLS